MFSFISSSLKSPVGLRLTLVALVCSLVSCQSTPTPEAQTPVVQQVSTPVELTAQQKMVNSLLAEADYCLSQNKLLNPIYDNAHDRYRAVLLMDPNNERAKEGLQTISLHLVDLARNAAKRGNLNEAQSLIRSAKGVDNNLVVQDAAETLRKQIGNAPITKSYTPTEGEVVLDAKLLQSRDPQLTTQLVKIAQKAKQTDEFVLITARTDADGRYIYQLLRNAVPGYLVRGDIKIGSPARVKLVKTLD